MSDVYKIAYIGQDVGYWGGIADRLQEQFSSLTYEFSLFQNVPEEEIQEIVINIINFDPQLIYIDFSKNSEDYLHLARVLKRLNNTKKIPLIGLHDNNTAASISMYAVNAHVFNNHIKNGEIHDVAYDAINLMVPGSNEELKFAMAQTSDEFTAYDIVKVGYVTPEYFFVEANRDFKEGQQIQLNNYLTTNQIIRSNYFEVKEKGENQSYYDKRFWYKLVPLLIDPIKKDPDVGEDLMKEKQRSREEELPMVKKKLAAWVTDNMERSEPKPVKMLFIDKLLNIYHKQPRSDRYDFVIRCQPYLREVEKEIHKLWPDIIIFQYDGKNIPELIKIIHNPKEKTDDQIKAEEEAKANADPKDEIHRNVPNIVSDYVNDDNTLKGILDLFRAKDVKKPFFLVFNSPTSDSKELQDKFGYQNMITQPGYVQPEIVMKMAEKLGAKLVDQMDKANKVVFKKNNPQSFAEVVFSIKFFNLCESEIHFTSTMPILPNQCIRLSEPVNMYLTSIGHNDGSNATVGKEGFRGLVNCTTEEDKQEIRKYINSLFFRDKEAAKAAEKAEFEKVKQAAINRKAEEEKKEAEMKAKAEAKEKEEEEAKKKAAEAEKATGGEDKTGEKKDASVEDAKENKDTPVEDAEKKKN